MHQSIIIRVIRGRGTVGNQNGSFRRKYAFSVPFGGRNGSSRRKMVGEKIETGDRSLTDR